MKKGLIVILVVCASVFGAKAYWYPRAEFYYKITVEIETPEGIKSGSAVRRVGMWSDFCPNNSSGFCVGAASVGEGVVIDLGEPRGVVFATTSSDDYGLIFKAFPYDGPLTTHGMKYYSTLKNKKTGMSEHGYAPRMVRFKDLHDPLSVELVRGYVFDPKTQKEMPVDHLDEMFGSGVRLKDVIVEIVDKQPLTKKVNEYLPWLAKITANIDGSHGTFSNELSNMLDIGHFKTGSLK